MTALATIAPRLAKAHEERRDELERMERLELRLGRVEITARVPAIDQTTRSKRYTSMERTSFTLVLHPCDADELENVIDALGGIDAFSRVSTHGGDPLFCRGEDDRVSVMVYLPDERERSYAPPASALRGELARRQRTENHRG